MNKQRFGFSLIELMVVIAIVALLSAVALPSYKQYTTRTKVAGVLSGLDPVLLGAKSFYSQKGYWPNAQELGYQASGDNVTVDDATTVHPNLISAELIGSFDGGPFFLISCSGYTKYNFVIDDSKIGNPFGRNFPIAIYLADIDGKLIMGCDDESDADGGSGHDYVKQCFDNLPEQYKDGGFVDFTVMGSDAGC